MSKHVNSVGLFSATDPNHDSVSWGPTRGLT